VHLLPSALLYQVTDTQPAAKDTVAQQALWNWTENWIEKAMAMGAGKTNKKA